MRETPRLQSPARTTGALPLPLPPPHSTLTLPLPLLPLTTLATTHAQAQTTALLSNISQTPSSSTMVTELFETVTPGD